MPASLVMPSSLEHFRNTNLRYVSSYSKSLSENCKSVKDGDYSHIFHQWLDHFLPNENDKSKISIRLEDWVYVKSKLFKLIKAHTLYYEQSSGEVGFNSGSFYVGKESMRWRSQQVRSNESFLNHINIFPLQGGQNSPLTSAKAERDFAEKYNICIGLEEYAKDINFGCLFVTITSPPNMHSNPKNGNNCWDGTSAKLAHDHLSKKWKNFQNSLSRKYGIRLSEGDAFGIKVVEPNCDGTPHWHILIYSTFENLHGGISELLTKYFGLTESSLTTIDCSKGIYSVNKPPTSYVLKSLEGASSLGLVLLAKEKRVAAWRSALGIRCFQRFGNTASTAAWQMFRRLHLDWMSFESQPIFERDKSAISNNLINRVFSISYKTMIASCTSNQDSKETSRRQFAEFITILKKLNKIGHDIFIKEAFYNKYGEKKHRTVGLNFGNAKYLFTRKNNASALGSINPNYPNKPFVNEYCAQIAQATILDLHKMGKLRTITK